MKISVIGLGYVGLISASCLAKDGFKVIGVEKSKFKLKLLKNKKTIIYEPNLETLLKRKIIFKDKVNKEVINSEIIFICVGTPSSKNGNIDLKYLKDVAMNIGRQLKLTNNKPLIVLRSTVFPGISRNVFIKTIENFSKKINGYGFTFIYHPEFLREGQAIYDYYNPGRIVFGTDKITKSLKLKIKKVYKNVKAPIRFTNIETAEYTKYLDNSFHALKVSYMNEIASLGSKYNVNIEDLYDIFSLDKKLNISDAYLKPGFAYGGSCLPKDVRALKYYSKLNKIKNPIINSLNDSNNEHILRALKIVKKNKSKNIFIYGLSFKKNTDDLRESPILKLIQKIKNKKIYFYDKNYDKRIINGQNLKYFKKFNLNIYKKEHNFNCKFWIFFHPYKKTNLLIKALKMGIEVLDLSAIYPKIKNDKLITLFKSFK